MQCSGKLKEHIYRERCTCLFCSHLVFPVTQYCHTESQFSFSALLPLIVEFQPGDLSHQFIGSDQTALNKLYALTATALFPCRCLPEFMPFFSSPSFLHQHHFPLQCFWNIRVLVQLILTSLSVSVFSSGPFLAFYRSFYFEQKWKKC